MLLGFLVFVNIFIVF